MYYSQDISQSIIFFMENNTIFDNIIHYLLLLLGKEMIEISV